MICDDEQDILNIYKRVLQLQFNVITVCSGRDCIEKYLAQKKGGNKIDVLLLDYRLGDMLGNEVACKIKGLDGTKVVLISAYDLDEQIIRDLKEKNCIVATMKKPIPLGSLADKLSSI
ncbi:MAG: response regulator [Nitrososphaera sp.]